MISTLLSVSAVSEMIIVDRCVIFSDCEDRKYLRNDGRGYM